MTNVLQPVQTSLAITVFVAAAMLTVEYAYVSSTGRWKSKLSARPWGQYAFAVVLGASPGCLGVFAAVALFTHGSLSRGALVAATIASCGDEAFVMLAMFPEKALAIFLALVVFGLVVGFLVGKVETKRPAYIPVQCLEIHSADLQRTFPTLVEFTQLWRVCSPTRGALALLFAGFLAAVATGMIGAADSAWIRITLMFSAAFGLFVVCTAPDHFLEEHLWHHIVRKHVPSIFLWTCGALLTMQFLAPLAGLGNVLQENRWALLAVACLIGLLPESGPHLVFVTLFAQGLIPLSVLLASCVVQDGHGMLPLLAYSRMEFMRIKAINLAAGVTIGAATMSFGY